MEITPGVFITCFITSLILTLYLCYIIYAKKAVLYRSIKVIFIGIALILIRMLLPVNFPFTVTIEEHTILPKITKVLYAEINSTGFCVADSIALIWIFGAVVRMIRLIRDDRNYKNSLLPFMIRDKEEYPELFEVLEECGGSGLKVCVLPIKISPAVTGFKTPILVLPEAEFSNTELRYICRHEMEHYKNHDLWLKLFIDLVVCVQWFNPLVYILKDKLSLIFELSSDLEIVKGCEEDQRLEYAEVLIKVKNIIKKSNSGNTISFVEYENQIQNLRFEYILDRRNQSEKSRKGGVLLQIVVVWTLIIGSFLFVPEAYRIEKAEKEGTLRVSHDNAYILNNNNKGYDLYVDGVYLFSFNVIPDEFENIEIINLGGLNEN